MSESTVFVGGRVYTGRRYAEALLVESGRVAEVGDEPSVRRTAPTGAERVDLAGALVVPGLADAHLHLGDLAREREAMDAGAARSIPDLQRRLRSYAEERPGRTLVADRLSLDGLAERRWPSRAELDAAVRDQPLVVLHASGHAAVVNSQALSMLPSSPAPPDSGVLREEELRPLRPLLEQALPLSRTALLETVRSLSRFGLTTLGAINSTPDELAILGELEASGELGLSVRAYLPAAAVGPSSPRGRTGAAVAVVGSKTFLDGAFGPRTASLDEPYADEPETTGIDRGDDGDLAAWIERCRRDDLTPALHAIGDRAVGRAARLLLPGSAGSSAGRVEHASLTPPSVLSLLQRSRPWAVVQPGFVLSDHWLRARLGPARARWAYAFRSLLDAGVPVAASSDAPYDSPDPWRGLRAAVERTDRLGRSANPSPDQALPELEALRLYTEGAHRALGLDTGGRLERGSAADLVVLGSRTLTEAIRRGVPAVRSTWWHGRPVYEAPPAPGAREDKPL